MDASSPYSCGSEPRVVEVDASHSVYVSQPAAVANLIKQAAAAATVAEEGATVA